MTEIFDMVLMVGDLVVILLLIYFIAEAALFFLDEFSAASLRIIQEYVSGYLSMSNFAPNAFKAQETFPAVNHMMEILENPPFVFVKAGSTSTSHSVTWLGEQRPMNILITYAPKTPLQYFLSAIGINGDCINAFCAFSGETQNNITVIKNSNMVFFLLNRDFSSGNMYALGGAIFAGTCGGKAYNADYIYGGTNSIGVQVRENGQIINDEGGNNWHEVKIGSPETINNLVVTLYSVNAKTNEASIGAACA